jgi:Fe2+ transport system protein FeoA
MLRVAPLGDPLELQVMDYHLSLRKAEALRVHVRPLAIHV